MPLRRSWLTTRGRPMLTLLHRHRPRLRRPDAPRLPPGRHARPGRPDAAVAAAHRAQAADDRRRLRPRQGRRAGLPRRRRQPHRDVQPEHGRPRSRTAASPARCRRRCPASRSAAPSRCWPSTRSKMAIVRSFRHPVGNHEQAISHVLTGGTDPNGQARTGFSMGSMYARLRGANHPRTGLPTYALLTDPHKDPQYSREMQRVVGRLARRPARADLRAVRPGRRRHGAGEHEAATCRPSASTTAATCSQQLDALQARPRRRDAARRARPVRAAGGRPARSAGPARRST